MISCGLRRSAAARGDDDGTSRLADVRDVLFVVDTINTRPGVSGQLWLDEVKSDADALDVTS